MAIEKDDFPADVVSAIMQGRKIDAIKLLREARNMGLKEAKDAVEAYEDARPELKARLDAVRAESNKKFLRFLVTAAAAAAAIYWTFFRN